MFPSLADILFVVAAAENPRQIKSMSIYVSACLFVSESELDSGKSVAITPPMSIRLMVYQKMLISLRFGKTAGLQGSRFSFEERKPVLWFCLHIRTILVLHTILCTLHTSSEHRRVDTRRSEFLNFMRGDQACNLLVIHGFPF